MSNFLTNIVKNVKDFYSELNGATLTGAIDVIVVEQEDGSFKCSPFHVRFGKLGVLKANEKVVDIEINDQEVTLKMKLDETGAAFFVEDVEDEDDVKWNEQLATSPLPGKSEAASTFGGRSLKLAPTKLNFQDQTNSELRRDDNEDNVSVLIEKTSLDSDRKGKLNKKKRRRRSQMKHARKGSKSSLREVLLDNEMFEMDDVNDAEDELGGSEPEDFYKKLEPKTAIKPKLEFPPPVSSHDTIDNEAKQVDKVDTIVPDVEIEAGPVKEEVNDGAGVTETVYVDTSAPGFHYFSDGEADRSGIPERPSSPGVVSDSEIDTQVRTEQLGVGWRWGELPNTPAITPQQPLTPSVVENEVKTEKDVTPKQEQTDSGGSKRSWFAWSKSGSEKKEPEGVYLDAVLADPDLQAKYLNPIQPEPSDPLEVNRPPVEDHFNEVPIEAGEVLSDDDESRVGLSLPMSPQGAKYDSDCEEMRPAATDLPSLICRHLPDLSASLCGGLDDSSITPDQFEAHLLSHQEFLARTTSGSGTGGILSDPNLVIRVHEKYMNWEKAAPILLSILLYKQPLPSDVVDKILKDCLDVNINISPEDIEKKKREDKARKTSSWWWWGAANRNDSPAAVIKPEDIKTEVEDVEVEVIAAQHETAGHLEDISTIDNSTIIEEDPLNVGRKFRKSLRLTSAQIEELNLNEGVNEVQFSVTTAFQGTTRAKCHIFLWRHTDKLIISDIDGTITKSDVLGHILPVIGKDWAHSGVADLYSNIHDNGYKIMYLSARAIGQSSSTKEYLQSVKQGDICLPDGPVFLNPDSLIYAFKREVIDRNPEEFKIRCLKDIQSLFGHCETNPFFAGYGNRPNDAYAYRAVGIPVSRIFTINPAGKLKHELTQNFTSSYIEQDSMVDLMFPPYGKDGFDPDFKTQEYSSFGFWRDLDFAVVDVDPDEIQFFAEEKPESDKKKKSS